MSLENALEKLAEAILVHAEAIKMAGTHSIAVAPHADLSEVKAAADTKPPKADKPAKADKPVTEEKGPFYWANNKTEHYGKVDTKAELDAIKKAEGEGFYLIPNTVYEGKVAAEKTRKELAEAEAKAAEAAAAEAAAAAADDDDPTSDLGGDEGDDELHVPTLDEYKAAWAKFLETDDPVVREERMGWTRQVVAKFGVKKATLIPEADWPKVYAAVQAATDADDLPDLDTI